MSGEDAHRSALPHIPSNLRIRRPRANTTSTLLAAIHDQDASSQGRVSPENQRSPGRSSGGFQGGSQVRPSLSATVGRQMSHRRRGIVEALAMNDRITNHEQNVARSISSAAAASAANEAAETRSIGSSGSHDNASGISAEPQSAVSQRDRPRLFAKQTQSRLPAVAEVSSPIEPSSTDAAASYLQSGTSSQPSATVPLSSLTDNKSSVSGLKSHDYAGSSSSTQGSPTQTVSASTAGRSPDRPSGPRSTHSALAAIGPRGDKLEGLDLDGTKTGDVSKDDTAATLSDRAHRRASVISIPTPLTEEDEDEEHHAAEVADYLDVIDAEVGTLSYLTNVQNSIFVPNIPALYDRRPVHNLPGSRQRSSTLTSLARRGTRRKSTSEASEGRASQDRQSLAATDLEQGQASVLAGTTGFAGGEKPTRKPSRMSVMSRMTSMAGFSRKEDYELPKHIKEWREMDEDERDELDEHVRLVLSKKSKFHRGLKGFWAFVKTPMGFIMTLYGFLITFWGTAIMLFIFGWIHVGERRRYWIEICDQILCALFAAVGLGFAPFRAVDTYRMIWIAKMHYRTWERRKQLGLDVLNDPNDLPRPIDGGANQVSRVVTGEPIPSNDSQQSRTGEGEEPNTPSDMMQPKHWWDIGSHKSHSPGGRNLLSPQTSQVSDSSKDSKTKKHKGHFVVPDRTPGQTPNEDPTGKTGDLKKMQAGKPAMKRNDSIKSELVKDDEDIVVLTKEEQTLLEHHQRKFHSSHTFYRYHETATHRAFPLDLMITIVCLLDCHSMLQGALGGCTWGIKYTHRPTALTATLISCSLSCNAMAGLLIYIGGRKTKKREEVERRLRLALETMAMQKIERRRARGELPDRNAEKDSKGSDSPRHDDKGNSDESADDERRDQAEFQSALNAAARKTEDEDQSQYDVPPEELERERQHHHFFHHDPTSKGPAAATLLQP